MLIFLGVCFSSNAHADCDCDCDAGVSIYSYKSVNVNVSVAVDGGPRLWRFVVVYLFFLYVYSSFSIFISYILSSETYGKLWAEFNLC